MTRCVLELLGGGLYVFLVSYLLTVTVRGAWSTVQQRAGELVLIAGLVFVCLVAGVLFSALTGVRVLPFLAGGLVVYLGWWLYLEVTAGPFDSPVHVLLGALFLSGFGLGAKLAEVVARRGVGRRRAPLE